MTTLLTARIDGRGSGSLYNSLGFVLKPNLDSLTNPTVNININESMSSYLCEISANRIVFFIHCCCDIFRDGFDDFFTISAGCLVFGEDPTFCGIDENRFDIFLDPRLRHCVNMRMS
jgi:hypothetical protein